MKSVFLLAFALFTIVSNAQDYQIDFAVYGNPETLPDSVVVHNLDQGNTLNLEGEDVLHLVASATGMAPRGVAGNQVEIYPNPFSDKATVVFPNDQEGMVQLSLFDMAGKLLSKKGISASSGRTVAEVGGLPPGAYVMHIETGSKMYSQVILSYGLSSDLPEITFKGAATSTLVPVSALKSSQKTSEIVEMQYNEGDSLAFTAYLNDLQTEIKIVPIVSTTLAFDFQNDREDILATADIIPEGGLLQAMDEFGNVITVTFPPGAVMDTVSATLTLIGAHKNLPMDDRRLRTFEIAPRDLKLYQQVVITVDYNETVDELTKWALCNVQTGSWLIPLSDHLFVEDSMSISARTTHLGEFAEGKMSLEQIDTQFDLLLNELGITWTVTSKKSGEEKRAFYLEDNYKGTWDRWKMMAGACVTFFDLKELNGYYDSGQASRQEDQEKLCEEIVNAGVKEVLDLPMPEDSCDYDYTYTLVSMVHDMEIYGCKSSSEYNRLLERYNQAQMNCSLFPDNAASFLVIHTVLNIESGGFEVVTDGTVPIFAQADFSNNTTIVGSGILQVSGSAYAGGQCSGVVSGETVVDVNGSRDVACTYALILNTFQTALLTTTCPGIPPVETPLDGGGVQAITLSLANNFSYFMEEPVDEGTFMMNVVLMNPFSILPYRDE